MSSFLSSSKDLKKNQRKSTSLNEARLFYTSHNSDMTMLFLVSKTQEFISTYYCFCECYRIVVEAEDLRLEVLNPVPLKSCKARLLFFYSPSGCGYTTLFAAFLVLSGLPAMLYAMEPFLCSSGHARNSRLSFLIPFSA